MANMEITSSKILTHEHPEETHKNDFAKKERLATDIVFSQYDDKRWVVDTPNGNHLLINHETKELLSILVSNHTIEEALADFNKIFHKNLHERAFIDLIQSKFGGQDILRKDAAEAVKRKSFLNFKITLFNEKIASLMAAPVTFLFTPYIFWVLFPILTGFNIFLCVKYLTFSAKDLHLDNIIASTAILYLTMLIHELGHIAALKRLKIPHGEIGFGIYIIFPILYANISKVWTASKNHRLISNLGGVYLELLYAAILGAVFLMTSYHFLIFIVFAILLKTLTELNPFIRYDGYWILSDLTNTPNLLPKANGAVNSFLKKGINTRRTRQFYFLLLYGALNTILISFYLLWMVFNYGKELLSFPGFMIDQLMLSLKGQSNSFLSLISFKTLFMIGFYLFFIRIAINLARKKLKKQRCSITWF